VIDDPASTIGPELNPTARTAYWYAVFGMIPFVGLVLGPLALVWGILGLRREEANPSVRGRARSLAGIILGSLELVTNWGGLALLWIGWSSLH
jgi:hypothetical protein